MKKIIAAAVGLCMMLFNTFTFSAASGDGKTAYIDNSSLLPKILPDSQVELDANGTPDWVESLIIGEVNLNTATPEGTLEAAVKVLDHYAEMGVNCIWLAPVYDPGSAEYPNGYENLGPHTINPKLTGTEDYEQGWKKLGWYVEEAHKRNIRIILDIITWGTSGETELIDTNPEYFSSDNGSGGYYFNWDNDAFVEWYIQNAVDIVLKTGCDGLRYDTEPSYAGYEVALEIRERLWDAGKKPFMMSERENERGQSYDVGQCGMTEGVTHETYKAASPIYFWLDKYNIVDSIKSGTHYGTQASQDLADGGSYHYYTFCISNHDYSYTVVNGNRAVVGYQAMYTPFIPVMLLGEEFNNPHHHDNPANAALYFNSVDWSCLDDPDNRALFEDIKAMIRIRRTYPEIFAYYPEEFKDSNICKVDVKGCELAQPYARYAGDTAMLVVPNYNLHDPDAKMTVYVPFEDTGLDYYKNYTVTDAETGEVIVSGSASKVASFTVSVPYEDQRIFMVKASGKIDVPDDELEDTDSGTNGSVTEPEPDDSTTEPDDSSSEPDDSTTESEMTGSETEPDPEDSSSEPEENGDPADNEEPADDADAESSFPVVPVVIAVVVVVLAAGGVTAFLIARKKKSAGQTSDK